MRRLSHSGGVRSSALTAGLAVFLGAAAPTPAPLAASAADAVPSLPARAAMMAQLAATLADNGDAAAAKAEALKLGALLHDADDLATLGARTTAVAVLVRLGDAAAAQDMAQAATAPAMRARLLGALGVDLAAANDTAGAEKVAALIKAPLKDADEAPLPGGRATEDAGSTALGGIGMALAGHGQPQAARAIASGIVNEGAKLRVLARIAFALCKAGPSPEGAALSHQIRDAAAGHRPDGSPAIRGGPAQAAAAAMACEGRPEAAAILDAAPNPGLAQSLAVSLLDGAGLSAAANALAPPPDPADPQDLVTAAQRRLQQGDRAEARRLAMQAAAAADHMPDAVARRQDMASLRPALFSVLVDLGAYDEALAAVRKAPVLHGFYLNALHVEANRRDTGALQKTLPAALQDAKGMGDQAPSQLCAIALLLVQGGLKADALTVFGTIARPKADNDGFAARYAMAQALLGDVPGALKTAELSGPLVTGGAAPKQEDAEPPAAGPRAEALSEISVALAGAGQVPAARQAEAPLEAEPKAALQAPRDRALAAIAVAEPGASDTLATAMQIEAPEVRFGPLLKAVAKAKAAADVPSPPRRP